MNARLFAVFSFSVLATGCRDETSDFVPSPTAQVEQPTPPGPPPTTERAPPVRADGTIYAETEQMGTRVSIDVWLDPGKTPSEAGAAIEAAFAEMDRIEWIMSEWQPETELSRLNRAAEQIMDQPMTLGPELFEVVQRANDISKATGGAFDVTFHGVGQLWKFTPGSQPPSREQVAAKLHLVDWTKIELDPSRRTVRLLEPGMKIGLGAIAKGYAVDRASALLSRRGFKNHIVEAGGDTYISGTKGGKAWMVGVQAPGRRGTLGVLAARDESVVTSGDYQRFFEFEGMRYSHILDPRTGWPVAKQDSPASVTVIAPNATDADAYCTAVAVMGAKAGMKFVEDHPSLEAVIVTQGLEVMVSKGLEHRYVATPDPGGKPTAADEPDGKRITKTR